MVVGGGSKGRPIKAGGHFDPRCRPLVINSVMMPLWFQLAHSRLHPCRHFRATTPNGAPLYPERREVNAD